MLRTFTTLFLVLVLGLASVPTKAEEGPSPDDVAFVQGLLLRFGYNPGPIDGICGNQTTAAVRAFHKDRNLPLKPGKIEPQAANVVENLTSELKQSVMKPASKPPTVYERALAGDPDAAQKVGMMYRDGDSVTTDKMMAYAWWSVAETYGSSLATALKADLEAEGNITPHEILFANALAEEICASSGFEKGAEPASMEADQKQKGREATM